jgi:hypothetical protein
MHLLTLPTNYQFVNLAGERYGRLVVLCYAGKSFRGKSRWLCQCDCDNLAIVSNSDLKGSKTNSCGCLKDKLTGARSRTHGKTYSREYKSWSMMIQRATNINLAGAKDYCLRGITVCDRWRSFENFYADMGERPPGMTLDRYPDKNGNYESGNCRWATPKVQNRNQRSNRIATVNGVRKSAVEIAEEYGVKYPTIISRMNRGMTMPLYDNELQQQTKGK